MGINFTAAVPCSGSKEKYKVGESHSRYGGSDEHKKRLRENMNRTA